MTRTLSARELASETDGSVEVIDWLTRIGILQTRTPQTYTFGDAFRVKMILSLLGAGFTHEDIESEVYGLETLLEWYEKDGRGEMPYPPDYPKMPGEPKRVQPSRARPDTE